MMQTSLVSLKTLFIFLLLTSISCMTHAEPYPDRPVRLVVPFTPGGNVDISARTIAQGLTEQLGQSVIVENRPGANTKIGAELVAKSPADGYTLLMGGAESLAINPHIYKNLSYDSLKDFTGVGTIGNFPFALVINPKLNINNLREFVDYAKSKSSKLNYSSWGIGSTSQITFEKFNQTAGIHLVHVPFQGASPAITAVAAGEVEAMMVPLSVAIPQATNGRIKIIGITSDQRVVSSQTIPTFTEQGYPVVMSGWQIIVAPRNTPSTVIAILNQKLNAILSNKKTSDSLGKIGILPVLNSPNQTNQLIETEFSRWGSIAKSANINAD